MPIIQIYTFDEVQTIYARSVFNNDTFIIRSVKWAETTRTPNFIIKKSRVSRVDTTMEYRKHRIEMDTWASRAAEDERSNVAVTVWIDDGWLDDGDSSCPCSTSDWHRATVGVTPASVETRYL